MEDDRACYVNTLIFMEDYGELKPGEGDPGSERILQLWYIFLNIMTQMYCM
jgi:hypothetical protein